MKPPPLPTPPAVTHYVILCLGSLGGVLLAELDRISVITLLALLVGLGGVLGRTRLTPVLFLLVLTMGQMFNQFLLEGFGGGWARRPYVFRPTDVLLCVAGLGFVLGHYRLQALTRHLLPTDPRERVGVPAWDWWSLGRVHKLVMYPRSSGLVTGGEYLRVAVAVVLSGLAALACWLLLTQWRDVLGLPPHLGRIALLGWLLAVGGYVLASLLGYWRRCWMSREQGLLVLQDMVWRETRQEQRHLNRDAARTRWRRSQRKDKS